MRSTNPKVTVLALFIGLLMFSNQLLAAVDILIIGSTHSYSEGGESGVVQQKAFNPTTVATRLQSILSGDSAIGQTVNVQFEDIYKTKTLITAVGGTGTPNTLDYRCYSLMQHCMWPENKTTRMANLRGEGTYAWDYIILCEDPYVMAHFPGTYAEAVKMIQAEIAKSANPAQLVLLAQWPDSTSTFTAANFNEIAHRVGNSGGITVVPAGKAWNSYTSKDTNATHPTPKGQYLAAAAIYSKLYNRSAKTSSYVYASDGSNIADLALSTVQSNNGVAQYTGKYTTANAFQMEYFQGRQVDWNEYGSSTEEGFAQGIGAAFTSAMVSNTRRNPPATGNPVHLSYSRGNDNFEPDKQYQVNAAMFHRVHGFPMGDHRGTTGTEAGELTMRYGIDKRYAGTSFDNGTDLGIAYSMVREGEIPLNVHGIPVRMLWSKINHLNAAMPSHADAWHLSDELNRAVGSYLYTTLSGRCPVEPEPALATTTTIWRQWWCRKIGYETAWQMAHLTTRAPGFRVSPSATTAKTVTPTTKETMTVEFVYPPQSDVTVNISISNANAAIVGSSQLVFTPQNYNVPQNVTVAGIPGSAASEAFNVVFSTVSTDEVYNGLNDSWAYTTSRSAPVTLTRVNKTTIQASASQNLPVTINLNTTGASSTTTILAGPSRGTAVWSGSNVIYTPGTDFTGKDGFSFATNNAGTLSVGYVEITVSAPVPNGMVSYRGNGSSGGAAPFDTNSYAQNATVTVLGNTGNLTKTASAFNGWNTAADGSGTTYSADSTFTMGAGGMILYAKWISAPTYTVTYNANVSSTGVVPSSQIKTDGVDLILATNIGVLNKNGYTFSGWNTLANGTGTQYAAGGTYSGNANVTLYARWTPNSYTVTFNANGGGTPSPTSKVVTNASPYGDLATVSYLGNTFNGWFTAATGGTKILPTTTVNIANNQILYAQWTVGMTYTVSYQANGATGGTVPADQTKLENVTLALATNTGGLTRPGYTFAGWNTAGNSTGTPYAAGASYTDNASVVLYAQWAGVASYTISYDGNGNTGGSAPSSQTKYQGVGLALATNSGNLTRTGFSLAGWNTAMNGGGTSYAVGANYTTDAAVTLYAQWNAIPTVNAGSNQAVTLGASVPWSPTVLGPQLWLDASSATSNAGTVSIANAGSDGGTISGPAALTAGGISTLQAVQFNGSGKYLTGDYTNTGTTLSAFFVGKSLNTTQTAYAGMMSVWQNDQASDWNNAGSSVLFNQNNNAANSIQTYRNAALSSTTGTLTAGFLAGTVFNGTTNTAYLNGIPSTSANSSGNFNTGKVVVGARWHTSVFNNSWNGNFGEAIICNTSLNASDREKVEGYLAHKWGLAGNLAVGHPHKDVPPGGSGAVATLDGTATDSDALTYAWTVVSGPAGVTFANATAIDTTATFTVAGTYTLRLTVNDGLAQVSDDIVVTVNAPGSTHSVTYNGNGSTGGSAPVDAGSPYTNGASVTVLGNTGSLVRTGYTFNNWNNAANGSGTSYSPAATFSINTPTTLYAQWATNSYTITFNSAGGSAVTAITQNYGTTVTAPTAPTRSGYTFAGWSPALPSTMPANNQTVTAQWNAIPMVNAGNDQTITLNSGSVWSPSQLTPQLWLDADDANTVALNGATVSQWADKSGYNHHATQTTGTAQPTATAAGLNGKRVITFDGTTDVFNVDLDFLAGVPHSAFIVTKPTAFTNIYGAANSGAGANSLHVGFNGGNYRMNYWGNDYSLGRTANFVAGSANLMNYVWIPGTSKQILANGKSEGISTSPVPGAIGTMAGGGRIGSVVGQGFFGGDIAELIIITGTVSAEDRQKMEAYLAHKWGLTGNLDVNHPYKTSAPGAATSIATLDGTATDTDALTTTWSLVSGPASVSFGNSAAIDTTATFTTEGVYTLRLTANDGLSTVTDDIIITVSSSYPVTYNSNNATSGTAPSNQTKNHGVSLTLATNTGTLARTGYTFAGWNTQTDGLGTSYAEGAAYTTNAALTLHAKWTMLPYTSWASSNGLTGNNSLSSANPDGDNLINLQEFAFGTDPTSPRMAPLSYVANGTTTGGTPILEKSGPNYRAVFARRKDYLAAGLTYTVSFSANLTHWKASSAGLTVLSGESLANVEAVGIPFPDTVPLSATETEHAPPKFFRVAVTWN